MSGSCPISVLQYLRGELHWEQPTAGQRAEPSPSLSAQLDSGAPASFFPHLLGEGAARCAVPPEISPAPLPTSPSECVFWTVGCYALELQTMLNLLVLWLGISGAHHRCWTCESLGASKINLNQTGVLWLKGFNSPEYVMSVTNTDVGSWVIGQHGNFIWSESQLWLFKGGKPFFISRQI